VYAKDDFNLGSISGGTGWGGNWSLTGTSASLTGGTLQLTGSSGVASRAISLSGLTTARLIFDWKANDFETGETSVVEIYDGTNWINVLTISDGQDDNIYHHSDISLSSYNLGSSFQVRFRSLMSDSTDVLSIENLKIAR
jgi:hypothetical protein